MDDGLRAADGPLEAGRDTGGAPDGRRTKGRGALPVGATATITGLVLGGLLLSACAGGEAGQTARAAPAPPPLSVAVTDVKSQDVRATFDGSGTAEAVSQVQVVPKTGGRVARLDAEVGQRVRAGQLLAELDHASQDAQVAQAEAALVSAQARLAQLQRGPRSEDVAAAAAQRDAAAQQAAAARQQAAAAAESVGGVEAQIRAGEQQAEGAQQQATAAGQQATAVAAQAATARLRLEQLQNPRAEDLSLLESGVTVARIRLTQAQTRDEEVRLAQTQVELARVALQQAQDGNRPEAIRAAQTQLDTAQTALAQIQTKPVREEDIETARLAVEAAELAWRSAQDSAVQASKSYNAVRQVSDNLPFGVTRPQADQQVAAAESGRIQADNQVEQAVIRRDQARAAYNKVRDGSTPWDVRQVQLQVEGARAQLDLTRNPDPARVRSAQLNVEQAQLQLESRREQIAFDLQQAEEGVRQAEAQLAKVATPGSYDLQQAEEAARAAQAQADAAAAQAQGAQAQAGAALAQVDALRSQRSGAAAQAAAAGNQANAAQAQVRGAEAQLALRQNPYTPEDFNTAQAGVAQAQAGLDLARTQRDEAFVYAPVDGLVSARNTAVGALAGPQAPVATLVSDAVEIAVPVEEAQFPQIQTGQAVSITTPAYPGERFTGAVLSVSPSGDTRSRSFTARIRPDDPLQRLRPGMFVQVSIATAERPAVPVVPREALVQREGRTSVYVVGADNKATLRPVQTGIVADRSAEITDGLQVGERVVVVGVEDLRDGQTVAPQPFTGAATLRP